MISVAEISNAALSLFHSLPAKGKPTLNQLSEFTVLAAIVAVVCSSDGCRTFAVSVATGTKCIGSDELNKNSSGCLLHDSHAEVLARRGFHAYLLNCIRFLAEFRSDNNCADNGHDDDLCALKWDVSSQSALLKPGWKFYLYSSDSPCGSSSIYSVQSFNLSTPHVINSTGAKPIQSAVSHSQDTSYNPEELRTKSGRSDILASHRTTSMSCSDKICRWIHLGLQGALLSTFLAEPIPLSGIVIGKDPLARTEDQLKAARLAFSRGSADIVGSVMPEIYIAPDSEEFSFPRSKAAVKFSIAAVNVKQGEGEKAECGPEISRDYKLSMKSKADDAKEEKLLSMVPTESECISGRKRKRQGQLIESKLQNHRPCGSSLNWVISIPSAPQSRSGTVEVTIASSGLLQGATLKSRNDSGVLGHREMLKCSSRLCRQRLAQVFVDTVTKIRKNPFRMPQYASDSICDKNIIDRNKRVPTIDTSGRLNDVEEKVDDIFIPDEFRPYRWWKDAYCNKWYTDRTRQFLECTHFCNWLRSSPTSGSNAALVQLI